MTGSRSGRGVLFGGLLMACSGQISESGGSHGRAGSDGSMVTAGTTGDATSTSSTTGSTSAATGTSASSGSGGTGGSGGRGGSTGGVGGGVDGGSAGNVEQLCVDTINNYRATLGLPPYARWNAEETCADGQAQSDSQTGTAHGAFGKCGEFAQNECPGWPNPPDKAITGCLQAMWNEGPGADFSAHGHYINMSSTKYTQVACGFYTTAAGKIWSVQDFK